MSALPITRYRPSILRARGWGLHPPLISPIRLEGTRRIYFHTFRVTIGLWIFMPPRPDVVASHAVPVRRAGSLPAASFGFRLAADTLAVRLTVPVTRVRRGLSPPSLQRATTAPQIAPLTAPCP